jgi:UDP-N-acetylmuramoylalanine--D-glutamate ligase
VATLAEAVTLAKSVAEPGDVVLLAPGFKSFDQFRNFEERGDSFIALVDALYRVPAERA